MENYEETLGIYIRPNKYSQQFELVQQEDGYIYDRKFYSERQARYYLQELVLSVKKYLN